VCVQVKKTKEPSEDMAVGHCVRIEGLLASVELNGRTDMVKRRHGGHGRWIVWVDGKEHTFDAKNLRMERVEVEDE